MPIHWPDEPYKGLQYYGVEDKLLFAGRRRDTDACANLLAALQTTVVLLHGRSGCGKSSFLRAGLIPKIEDDRFGFFFLRRAKDASPSFIRCTADPLARIAENVFAFTDWVKTVDTEIGEVSCDLSDARCGRNDVAEFIEFCRIPENLMEVLSRLCSLYQSKLVLILDQAEEIITLKDADRDSFFKFLHLFTGRPISAKLIVALRTENFGEFFRHVHTGAMKYTNVRPFLLEPLDRAGMKAAMELPTSGKENHDWPYRKYEFEFQEGLVDRILDDLFRVDPSGGILPVMQIVCRDLFHDLPAKPALRLISIRQYEGGDGVSGRIDKHISRSLRNALRDAGTPESLLDVEEAKWRKGLSELVLIGPDGTARTDVSSEHDLVERLRKTDVVTKIAPVLKALLQPDTLVLRSIDITDPSGKSSALYSLAHDAIGLALRQWAVRYKEAERRKALELKSRRQIRWFASIASAIVALLVLGFGWVQQMELRQQSSILKGLADRSKYTDLKSAGAELIEAARRDRLAYLPFPVPANKLDSLKQLVWSLPMIPVDPHFKTPAISRILPQSGIVVSWSAQHGLRFDSWLSKKNYAFRPEILVQNGLPQGARFDLLSEAAPGFALLRFIVSGQSGARDHQLILAYARGKLSNAFDARYFATLGRAGLPAAGTPLDPADRYTVYSSGRTVYLWKERGDTRSAQAFFLDTTRTDGEFVFRPTGWLDIAPSSEPCVRSFDGIFVVSLPNGKHATSCTLGNWTNLKAYDLQRGREAWSPAGEELAECAKRDMDCYLRGTAPDAFMVLNLYKKNTGQEAQEGDQRRTDTNTFIIRDMHSGHTRTLNAQDVVAKLQNNIGLNFAGLEPTLTFMGNGRDIVIGTRFGNAFALLDYRDDLRFRQVVLSGAAVNAYRIAPQTGNASPYLTVIGAGKGKAYVWPASAPRNIAKMSAQELTDQVCAAGAVRKIESADVWHRLTGFTDDPPPYPCRDDEPAKEGAK